MKKVIDFLSQLREDNTREWFHSHKSEYSDVKEIIEEFAVKLIDGIASFDSSVKGLDVKDCTYRINRDTRFSNNKLPYKTHIGIYVSQGGKKSGRAGYYVHFEPKSLEYNDYGFLSGSSLSAGLYMPEPFVLRSVREDISHEGIQFISALKEAKGFELETANVLKRVPKGFEADSPYIEYLKLKEFIVSKPLNDELLADGNMVNYFVEEFSKTYEFVHILNRAVNFAYKEMR